MNKYEENRRFMKSSMSDFDLISTADIANGIPQPSFQNPAAENSKLVNLQKINSKTAPKADFFECTSRRISRRAYSKESMTIDELSFLLWCTQGVKEVIGGYQRYIRDGSGRNYLRPVATGGSIPAYETYLAINNISGIDCGVWKYLPLSNQLLYIKSVEDLPMRISSTFTNPSQNQSYAAKAAVVFFWVCRPYYGEWRYKETAHKLMLIDLGHISHQLYLATETIGCGCCAIGGYYQDKADELIGVDGEDEFTVLCASVGHIIP
jgi:SagB-type dehydrogenase family enzyme